MGSHHERVNIQQRRSMCVPGAMRVFPPRLSLFPRVSVGMEMMFCAEGCTAVIDTGSSYITGPASSVSLLMKTIGAQLDESGVKACNTYPTREGKTQVCDNPTHPFVTPPPPRPCSTKSAAMPWRRCPASRSTLVVRSTPSLRRTTFCG